MIRNVYPGCRIPDLGSRIRIRNTAWLAYFFYQLSNFDISVTCLCLRLAANEIEKHSRDRGI
jgi:hypothetical protein